MEAAVQKFITLASTGLGAKNKMESTELVIDAFRKAMTKAVEADDETGKVFFLLNTINKLERSLITS